MSFRIAVRIVYSSVPIILAVVLGDSHFNDINHAQFQFFFRFWRFL